MNTTHDGNGTGAKHDPDDDEFPRGIFAVAHRHPAPFFDLMDALDRLLASAADIGDFSRCTDPCPLCHPATWPTNSY